MMVPRSSPPWRKARNDAGPSIRGGATCIGVVLCFLQRRDHARLANALCWLDLLLPVPFPIGVRSRCRASPYPGNFAPRGDFPCVAPQRLRTYTPYCSMKGGRSRPSRCMSRDISSRLPHLGCGGRSPCIRRHAAACHRHSPKLAARGLDGRARRNRACRGAPAGTAPPPPPTPPRSTPAAARPAPPSRSAAAACPGAAPVAPPPASPSTVPRPCSHGNSPASTVQ